MERERLTEALESLAIPRDMIDSVPTMPEDPLGLLVYGSWARGDAVSGSDLDLLVVVENPQPSTYSGDVSLSYYTIEQLESGKGTLFGAHLRRDAKVLWDVGDISTIISMMGDVDTTRLFVRARNMSKVLGSPERDLPRYLPGLLREARYLLRSCLYARAIADGNPCFSVREIAQRYEAYSRSHFVIHS